MIGTGYVPRKLAFASSKTVKLSQKTGFLVIENGKFHRKVAKLFSRQERPKTNSHASNALFSKKTGPTISKRATNLPPRSTAKPFRGSRNRFLQPVTKNRAIQKIHFRNIENGFQSQKTGNFDRKWDFLAPEMANYHRKGPIILENGLEQHLRAAILAKKGPRNPKQPLQG